GLTKFQEREIGFFDRHWIEGPDWYFAHFKANESRVVGEKTAELLHRMVAHRRMFQVIPNTKLIVLLREPVSRAYSQWRMAMRPRWGESRTFRRAVEDELHHLRDNRWVASFYGANDRGRPPWCQGYVVKGFYSE